MERVGRILEEAGAAECVAGSTRAFLLHPGQPEGRRAPSATRLLQSPSRGVDASSSPPSPSALGEKKEEEEDAGAMDGEAHTRPARGVGEVRRQHARLCVCVCVCVLDEMPEQELLQMQQLHRRQRGRSM